MTTGCVFNVQRFSTDDGNGIRTCVFLKGCPLRCAWCHNAEGLSFAPELAFYEKNCIGCSTCITVCEQKVLSIENGAAVIQRDRCISCGKCAEVCPTGALIKIGKDTNVSEVMKTVLRDRPFYKNGGGVTITGGEPLAQAKFARSLAKAAKREGISVTIETSGFGKTEDVLSLVPFCDLFLFDCKASSMEHEMLTGVTDELILRNLYAICQAGASVILRCPVVGGANLNENFTKKIIMISKNEEAIKEIQLMPYHATGIEKSTLFGKLSQKRYERPSEADLSCMAQEIALKSGKPCFYEKN